MVGPLRWFNRDPNLKDGINRGPGYYYHRGNGYYSKYSSHRDSLIRRGPWSVGGGSYKHVTDYGDFKKSPSYPTNRKNYKHRRRPLTRRRLKDLRRLR